jgi:4-carboxymuconolactone decarboxylase
MTRPKSRLTPPVEGSLNDAQKRLREAIASGPRGEFKMVGPFAIYMQAPEFGIKAQELGGYLRLKSSLPPRLSEFAILCTAARWRAQFEWVTHGPIAEREGVAAQTIEALRSGRRPEAMRADEAALYDFIDELYGEKRVSDAAYAKVQKLLGDAGTVELVGILGYYALVSMQLNVFNSEIPADSPLPFEERW